MDVKDWLYLVGLLISLIVGAIGAYPAIWSVKSATRKTDVDAVFGIVAVESYHGRRQPVLSCHHLQRGDVFFINLVFLCMGATGKQRHQRC